MEGFIENRGAVRKSNAAIFSAPHKQSPLWSVQPSNIVTVSARYKDSKGWHSLISKNPLPKNVSIQFTGHTNVKTPFSVFWQVVNTGQEAGLKEDLRGSIVPAKTAGKGGLHHNESTRYSGTHWIECFIVKDNVCVARSEEFIVKVE